MAHQNLSNIALGWQLSLFI